MVLPRHLQQEEGLQPLSRQDSGTPLLQAPGEVGGRRGMRVHSHAEVEMQQASAHEGQTQTLHGQGNRG